MKVKSASVIVYFTVAGIFLFSACTKEGITSGTPSGKGGSLSRFTIAGDYLYLVSGNSLSAYSLQNPSRPEKVYTSGIDFQIETIYPFDKLLFLGSRTGMYIYSIEKPSAPRLIGQAVHARSCDPVVASKSVAYVTLTGSGACGPAVSGLYVHDITDITKPVLKKTIELPDPAGLGLQDEVLYVCCGNFGLKVFDISKPFEPVPVTTLTGGNYIDVIPYEGTLICFVQNGIVLYDITNPVSPVLVKEIAN
jgi:hypothetical protein